MGKFREAIQSMGVRGWVKDELLERTGEGSGRACLMGHLALAYELAWDQPKRDDAPTVSIVGHGGKINFEFCKKFPEHYPHSQDYYLAPAEQYVQDLKALAKIIVEFFPGRLLQNRRKYYEWDEDCNAEVKHEHVEVCRDLNAFARESLCCMSIEEMIDFDPQTIISTFNDNLDTTVEEAIAVLEKAAIADESDVKLSPEELANALVID